MADISAIVVSFRTGPVLARTLDTLRLQAGVAEIILVDNGNPDGAIAAAVGEADDEANDGGGKWAPVRVLSGHGNVGFSVACNMGARAAAGKTLLFVNPDAILPPGAAARLAADGAAQKRPWLIGAKIIDVDGAEQRGSRRATLTPWRAFVEAAQLYRLAPRHPYFRRFNLHDTPCPTEVTPVPVISGACFCMLRDDFFAIGAMDERYFLHVEDVDLCLRVADAGGGVYFDPHVSVLHFKSTSDADSVEIDHRKTSSMLRYFNAHFRGAYPPFFLSFVGGLLWLRWAAKALILTASGARKRGAPLEAVTNYSGARQTSKK